jgi:hypothetical protein
MFNKTGKVIAAAKHNEAWVAIKYGNHRPIFVPKTMADRQYVVGEDFEFALPFEASEDKGTTARQQLVAKDEEIAALKAKIEAMAKKEARLVKKAAAKTEEVAEKTA